MSWHWLFHSWSNWSEPFTSYTFGSALMPDSQNVNMKVMVQIKTCAVCNKKKWRTV